MTDPYSASAPLGFAEEAAIYKGATQNARVLSEGWIAAHGFCPACGGMPLTAFAANSPVADFHCRNCAEEYELKSTKGRIDTRLVNGALGTMTARLAAANNPNLMVMRYDRARTRVTDLIVVPGHFFTQAIIEPRKPLSMTARRAGWQGCNILIGRVPLAGRIPLIRDGATMVKQTVLDQWQATLFLRDAAPTARGWLLEVMKCVEDVVTLNGRPDFTLAEVYGFEGRLAAIYPGNNNVRPKIRQQLQVLRDRGWLAFDGRGTYRPPVSAALRRRMTMIVTFVILRQAASSRRRPGDPAACASRTLSRIQCLNRSPSALLGPPVSLCSPEDDERNRCGRMTSPGLRCATPEDDEGSVNV